jgi:hypothetical protein
MNAPMIKGVGIPIPTAIEPHLEDWPILLTVAHIRMAELIRDNHELAVENEELRAGYPYCDTCGSQPCANPSFCEACRRGDAQRQRDNKNPDIIRARRLLDDKASLERAWSAMNRKRGGRT